MAKIDLIHARKIIEKTGKMNGIQKVEFELEDGILNININGYDFSVYEDGAVSTWETIPSMRDDPGDSIETEVIEKSKDVWESVSFLFGAFFHRVIIDIEDGEAYEQQYAKEMREENKWENSILDEPEHVQDEW